MTPEKSIITCYITVLSVWPDCNWTEVGHVKSSRSKCSQDAPAVDCDPDRPGIHCGQLKMQLRCQSTHNDYCTWVEIICAIDCHKPVRSAVARQPTGSSWLFVHEAKAVSSLACSTTLLPNFYTNSKRHNRIKTTSCQHVYFLLLKADMCLLILEVRIFLLYEPIAFLSKNPPHCPSSSTCNWRKKCTFLSEHWCYGTSYQRNFSWKKLTQ